MALSESVWASCSWWSEDLFGQSFSIAPPIHSLRGLPCLGSFSVQHIRHIERPPLSTGAPCRSVHQSLKGAPWVGSCSLGHCTRCLMGQTLLFSCQCWRMGRERLWWCLHPLRATRQYRLASMTAQLSSTGISHHSLPPHIPEIHLSAVYSSPCPGIAPQSLNSSSQPLCLPGDPHPCPGYVWLWQGLFDSHSI